MNWLRPQLTLLNQAFVLVFEPTPTDIDQNNSAPLSTQLASISTGLT
jgi:hypothetical protein